jgi:homoserine dehydrogenase
MRIMLIGYGNVGKCFHGLLDERREFLTRRYGITPKVVSIVDRGGAVIDPKGIRCDEALEAKRKFGTVAGLDRGRRGMSAIEAIGEVDCEVVTELTPSNLADGEPGMSHIVEAMRVGRHVITANKGPLALALPALLELASHNDVKLLFSGTVGGGTPFLNFIRKCLKGNEILSLRGVLNGTTNFVLSTMERKGRTMEEALLEAKDLGYAEADPSLDVNGLDAAAKLAILTNVALGRRVTISDVEVEGIAKVSRRDVSRALDSGMTIRLIAEASHEFARVQPREIGREDPLCVYGPLNALSLVMEGEWQVTLVGKGAGGFETAQALVRDLVELKESLTSTYSTLKIEAYER